MDDADHVARILGGESPLLFELAGVRGVDRRLARIVPRAGDVAVVHRPVLDVALCRGRRSDPRRLKRLQRQGRSRYEQFFSDHSLGIPFNAGWSRATRFQSPGGAGGFLHRRYTLVNKRGLDDHRCQEMGLHETSQPSPNSAMSSLDRRAFFRSSFAGAAALSFTAAWQSELLSAADPAPSTDAAAAAEKAAGDKLARFALSHLAAGPDHDDDHPMGRPGDLRRLVDSLRSARRRRLEDGEDHRQALSRDRPQGPPLRANRPRRGHGVSVQNRQQLAFASLPHYAGQGYQYDSIRVGRRLRHRHKRHRHQRAGRQAGALLRALGRRPGVRQRPLAADHAHLPAQLQPAHGRSAAG